MNTTEWLPRKATEEEMGNVQTEALRLADRVEKDPLSFGDEAAAELRRLAAVEQELEALKRAISDAEPEAWIRPSGKAMLDAGGYCTVYASTGMSNHSTPLYTLKGIK